MTEILYSTRHLTALFGVTRETVRIWSEEFARFLSPTAKPGRNKSRNFTTEDLAVFALVSDLKDEGMTFAEIHIALSNGQRGNVPLVEPQELDIIVARQDQQVSVELEVLQQALTKVQQQYNDTLTQYQQALVQIEEARLVRDENIQLKSDLKHSEGRVNDLIQRLETAERRIQELVDDQARLREEVGKSYAKGVIDLLRKRGDLPAE